MARSHSLAFLDIEYKKRYRAFSTGDMISSIARLTIFDQGIRKTRGTQIVKYKFLKTFFGFYFVIVYYEVNLNN